MLIFLNSIYFLDLPRYYGYYCIQLLFIYVYLCNYHLFCFLSLPNSSIFFGTSYNKHLLIPGFLIYVFPKFLFHLFLWKIFSFITLKISYLYSLTPKFPGKRLNCKLKCTSYKVNISLVFLKIFYLFWLLEISLCCIYEQLLYMLNIYLFFQIYIVGL